MQFFLLNSRKPGLNEKPEKNRNECIGKVLSILFVKLAVYNAESTGKQETKNAMIHGQYPLHTIFFPVFIPLKMENKINLDLYLVQQMIGALFDHSGCVSKTLKDNSCITQIIPN